MSNAVAAFVLVSIAVVVFLGAALGMGPVAAILLGLIVALGALAIAVARKAQSGEVEPARCRSCGGLMSPNAPSCKHCGAPVGP